MTDAKYFAALLSRVLGSGGDQIIPKIPEEQADKGGMKLIFFLIYIIRCSERHKRKQSWYEFIEFEK